MKYTFPFLLLALSIKGWCQANCVDALPEAAKNYELGLFENVVKDLNRCLPALTDFKSKVEAHKLLTYTYLVLDSIPEAEREIQTLVAMKPDYESELEAPVLFTLALDDVKERMAAQITSSVSKKAEKIELAPATIEVITEEEILRRGYRSLEEVFHDISGFDITSTKGEQYTLLYQRGYRSDLGDRTLVLINGIEDNGLFTNEAHITRQYPLSNIDRVEIIYGPASTMYGANAFQGVINIVTKDARQLVKKGNHIGLNVHSAYGTWNTRVVDATVAGHHRKASFSLTGRAFLSDEMDLSPYEDFDFNFDLDRGFSDSAYRRALRFYVKDEDGQAKLEELENLSGSDGLFTVVGDSALPTQTAIQKAKAFDRDSYTSPQFETGDNQTQSIASAYSNPTENYYLSGRFSLDKLQFGFQLWQKKEGQGALVTDRFFASGDATSWQVRHFTFFSQYATRISDKIFVSNLTTFKNFAHFPELRQTQFNGYVNGVRSWDDLVAETPSSWSQKHSFLRSKQLKNELKAALFLSPRLDVVSGLEVRFGAIPQTLMDMNANDTTVPPHLGAQLSEILPGGNVVHSNEFGLYTQGSYVIHENLRATLGARADYNIARESEVQLAREVEGFGYGLRLNPRLALVYNPRNYIFKAIYASAFLNPSNFQRFGSSAGRIPNPSLETEQVQNLDLSARWNINADTHIEAIAYQAWYNGAIQTLKNSNGELQFQATGSLNITGLQVNSRGTYQRWGYYANYSFCYPSQDDTLIGDISRHSANAGSHVNLLGELVTLGLGGNYVGNRPTGKETTVEDNPKDEIEEYLLFDGTLTISGQTLSSSKWTYLRGLSLQVSVNNLFNVKYSHPGARSADGLILTSEIPQETRNLFIRLQYQF